MALKDYEHWNEDALYMWWNEEGKHVEEPDYDPYDPYNDGSAYDDAYSEGEYDAENEEGFKPQKYANNRDLQRAYEAGYEDTIQFMDRREEDDE